jgi:hypothetical protein
MGSENPPARTIFELTQKSFETDRINPEKTRPFQNAGTANQTYTKL